MFELTPFETEAILLSIRIASVSMLFSLPFGIAVAWVLARTQFPGKSLVDAIVYLPMVVPPVVVGYLLLIAFGRRGVLGAWMHDTLGITFAFNWKGAALAAAVMAFPLMVRAMRLSLEAVDRGLESAARTLGANRIRVFLTITLPLMMPGILAGAVLCFARAFGEFGATITFVSNIPGETRTLPLALYSMTQTPDGEGAATRLAVLAAGTAILALVASEWLARGVRRRLGEDPGAVT